MTLPTDPERIERLCDALRRVADDLASHQPEPQVPRAALLALERRCSSNAPARRPEVSHGLRWAGAAVAMVVCVVAVGLQWIGQPAPDHTANLHPNPTAFLPLVDAARWSHVASASREQEPAWVVPAELPRESLGALGLPYDPARAGESVRAELLMHPSGEVLAVRFVP